MSGREQIIQINENTWRIEDGMVRIYLLEGSEKALLVDTGMTLKDAREIAERLTDKPVLLINTHGDVDHIAGNAAFDSIYMSPAEEEGYRTNNGTGTIIPVKEGDILDLGGRKVEIIELPGHTPGSIAILDITNRALISGDPIQDGSVFMFGAGRDLKKYVESLRKLQENYADRFDTVYPAHGTFPIEPALIPKLIKGAERVLAGEVESEPHDFHGISIRRYDIGCAGFLMSE